MLELGCRWWWHDRSSICLWIEILFSTVTRDERPSCWPGFAKQWSPANIMVAYQAWNSTLSTKLGCGTLHMIHTNNLLPCVVSCFLDLELSFISLTLSPATGSVRHSWLAWLALLAWVSDTVLIHFYIIRKLKLLACDPSHNHQQNGCWTSVLVASSMLSECILVWSLTTSIASILRLIRRLKTAGSTCFWIPRPCLRNMLTRKYLSSNNSLLVHYSVTTCHTAFIFLE